MDSHCIVRQSALRLVLFLGPLSSASSAQIQTWITQFGTAEADIAWAAAPDGSGGSYLGGTTYGNLAGQGAGDQDGWLARFDAGGSQTWVRQFGTAARDDVTAVAPDGSGGVYVTGYTRGSLGGPNAGVVDAWLSHYDGAGNLAWALQIGTASNDTADALSPDGSGGVYVTGYTLGSLGGLNAGSHDAWVARYDSAGTQLWLQQFGTTGWDDTRAVARDGAGGVYVCGYTSGDLGGANAGDVDAWVARYDEAGNQSWVRQFGSPNGDEVYAATHDETGGVFVTGYTFGDLGGPIIGTQDAWLAHYDGAGNQSWIQQFGTTSRDVSTAAAPDGSGGVILAGRTWGALGGPNEGSNDVWLAHFDGTGDQRWSRQMGTTSPDDAEAAASDGAGGVFVCGYTSGSLGGTNAGETDAWVLHYDNFVAVSYCTPAIPNSTGRPGVLTASGSNEILSNDVTLFADQLPQRAFGIFLTSQVQGSTFPVTHSQGRLCLDSPTGRYNGAGQVRSSGTSGSFSFEIDLASMPQPLGGVAVQPGETWNFQAWHRDTDNGMVTSNFTDAVSVLFN